MVSIPTGLAINTSTVADRTTAAGMRKVLGGMVEQTEPGVPKAGILYAPGNPLLVAVSDSAMEYSVTAGFAVTTRTGQGAYIVGTTDDVTVTTNNADSTNPRIDIIYIVQPDPELAEEGHARIDVAVGTPAATPVAPDLPTGALELARKTVPAGAANTSTGGALTNFAGYTGFPPSSHSLDSHTGVLSIAKGGTGATSKATARAALGVFVQQDEPASPAPGDIWLW